MTTPLLNPNQRRHLGASLGLRVEELRTVSATLPEASWTERVRQGLAATCDQAVAVLGEVGESPRTPIDPPQRLAALCGVWLARLHDLRAAKLVAYGPVAPALAPKLDPAIARLAQSLTDLLELAE